MAEVPGPGSYERNKSQEHSIRKSPERMFADQNARFKSSTDRDDHMSYLAHEKTKAPIAPNNYFSETRPFLKKSFNASLPPPKFV